MAAELHTHTQTETKKDNQHFNTLEAKPRSVRKRERVREGEGGLNGRLKNVLWSCIFIRFSLHA